MPFIDVIAALIVLWVILLLIRTYVPMGEGFRSIASVVLGLLLVGVALWVINTYVPMAGSIKAILNLVVVVWTCVWTLKVLGVWPEVVRLWNNLRFPPADHSTGKQQ